MGMKGGSKFCPASVSFRVEGCSNRKNRAEEDYKKTIVQHVSDNVDRPAASGRSLRLIK